MMMDGDEEDEQGVAIPKADMVAEEAPVVATNETAANDGNNNDNSNNVMIVGALPSSGDDAGPWWMDFLKSEGLLEEDTASVFQNGSIIGAEDLQNDDDDEEGAAKQNGNAKPDKDKLTDNDDGDEEDSIEEENEDDWKERIWVVARNHWKYDLIPDEPSVVTIPASETEAQTLVEEEELAMLQAAVQDDQDHDHIVAFRRQLLACLFAYVQVFSSSNNDPSAGPASVLRSEATHMSPYVPLNVARQLFVLVLRSMKEMGKTKDTSEASKNSKPSADDANFHAMVEHVTQVLFSPEMDVFRTYMVEPQTNTTSDAEDTDKKDPLVANEGKRVRTDRIADERHRQRETEQLLYGDMYAEEKKDDMAANNFEQGLDSDGPEEEVRIRIGVATRVKSFSETEDSPVFKVDWTLPFVEKVLLAGLLHDSLLDNPMHVSNFLSARVDHRSETSLAYMYAIRYFPHFYIRSSWRSGQAILSDSSTLANMMQYLGDARLIRNRLVVLGIYNGVMVHLRELDALSSELGALDSFDDKEFEGYLKEIHRTITECLCSVLEENMRSANFLPSKTGHGIDWKMTEIRDSPNFRIENDHPQIVSVCLEIGRSFHLQGVTLGKRAEDKLSQEEILSKRNFDDVMTELETDAYLEGRSAFQGALKVLRGAEKTIQDNHLAQIQEAAAAAQEEDDPLAQKTKRVDTKLDKAQSQALKHINEARITIELYLADTLTTLSYCYEAKLSENKLALKWYNDSLSIYARHVGKDHPTVIHALQSVGEIHAELKQWKEARRCFEECLGLLQRRIPPDGGPNPNAVPGFYTEEENTELAFVLKCLGVAQMNLGAHDDAFDSLSRSIDQRTLAISQRPSAQEPANAASIGGPPQDTFICGALSKLVDVLFSKLLSLKSTYTKRRLAMLYSEDVAFDIEALDGPRLARLQVERRVIGIARDAVHMRRRLLNLAVAADGQAQTSSGPEWYDVLDLVEDLAKLGKLFFRRCDYADAIQCWTDALELMESNPSQELPDESYSKVILKAVEACKERKVNLMSELPYLVGVAACREGQNSKAIPSLEKSLLFLEEKRKLFNNKGSGPNGTSEDSWNILDMDVGYCEHALGLAYFYDGQQNASTAHYRESLRLFEAVAARRKAVQKSHSQGQEQAPKRDPKKAELDVSINTAIAGVMLSLGSLYHEQQKMDRSRRFLEGAIQIVYSTTSRILSTPRDAAMSLPSVTGFSDMSLVVAVVRVGDAHRRIAMMGFERREHEDAKLALETAMRYLESSNLESRLSLSVDDETHLEVAGQKEVDEMLMSCYELMIPMSRPPSEGEINPRQRSGWWGGGGQGQDEFDVAMDGGLTKEDVIFRLANLHAKRGNFDSAIRGFLETKDLTEERLGTSEHPIIGNILFNLGNVYNNIYKGQKKKADQKARERSVDAFVESLRIAKLTSGPESLAAAEVMEALASVLMEDEDLTTAERVYTDDDGATNFLRDAVAVRNKHGTQMSLPFARSMHHLGLLRLRQQLQEEDKGEEVLNDKKLDEAISCLSEALRIRRILLGDHLDVATSAGSLGVALWKRAISPYGSKNASVNDAIKQLNDALFIRTALLERDQNGSSANVTTNAKDRCEMPSLGAIVMATVENMYDIAEIHRSQRNFEAQRECLKNGLELMKLWIDRMSENYEWDGQATTPITTSERNIWTAKIYNSYGVSWFEETYYDKAISDFEQSLKFRGLDIFETATADEVFDNFFRQKNEQRQSRKLGLAPLASAFTMEQLALSYDKTEKLDDALRCYSYCLRVYGEHFGTNSVKVASILRRVGKVYEDRHDYKRCVRALQRALHIRDVIEEDDYVPRVADALVFLQLARSLMALGAYDEIALEHYHSSVGILEDLNIVVQSQPATRRKAFAKQVKTDNSPEDGIVDGHNTFELLLEGYSSILVLLRRQEDDTRDKEQNVFEVIHNIGNTQAALHQYEKAAKSLNHVLKFQRDQKGDEHLSVADLLFNLGNVYIEMGEIDLARECHLECHHISVSVLGNDSVELAENMMCIGNIEFVAMSYPMALEWFDGALRLLRDQGSYEIAVTKCLHRKAVAHDKIGDYDKSIECFGEVLRLGRKIWGMNHLELSNILLSVGNVHRNRGEIRRALKCYEESLRIRTRSGSELATANAKNNIGAIFMSMDKTDRARQFYADALRIKTETLGPDDIETARTLYNMGQLYLADRQQDKGLRFFTEALRVFKLRLGDNHVEVASCLCSIGTVYDEMADEEVALSYFKKALAAVKGEGGSNAVRAGALHNIGIILTKRKDIDHAVRIFREALEIKSSEDMAEDMSDTQFCLANVLRLTGCVNEALELHKAALDTRIHYLGRDHVDVADSMFGLSQTLVDSSKHRDALNILYECVRIRKLDFGDDSDEVADATFLLGSVLREVGNLSESLSCLKAALEVKARTSGKTSAEVADISFKIAIVLCEQGKFEEAKSFNRSALAIRSASSGKFDNEIAGILENMGIIEQKLGNHEKALEELTEAVNIKRGNGGEKDHEIGTIVHAMAESYAELDKFDEAIKFFEDAVKRKKVLFGPKHIEVARVLVDEGRVFERTEQLERALMCYEEAIDSDCYEDNTWELGRVFMRMGVTHFVMRKTEDSWDCLSEATRVFEFVERKERRAGVKRSDSKLRSQRDLHELIKCYECMLRLSEASPNRYSIDRSLVLPKVASVLVEIKQYDKAAALFRDAIELQRTLPGDTRFVVATNLHNLGNCLHHMGDFNEAFTNLEDSLGLLQDIPGVEGKHIADTYHSLAVVHHLRSDMHEALTCYSNALKSRKGDDNYGNEALVSTLVSMGEVLRTLGMYDAATKSCKDSLRLIDAKGDSKLLLVARVVECIGLTHKDRFEYEKALRCYRECLKQRKEALGPKNILVGKTLHDMALVLKQKGEKEKATNAFNEALQIFERYIGFELPADVNSKGCDGKAMAETISVFFEDHLGENLVADAETIITFGSLVDERGYQKEAILCYERAIQLLEERIGNEHLLIALAKHRIGTIHFKQEDYKTSVAKLREALHVRRSKLGDNHIDTEDTLKTLSRAYAAAGDSEMALFYFKEVVNIRKERASNKTDSESEADLLLRLGKLHLEQHEYSDALQCFKDSLRLQRQSSLTRDEKKLGETLRYMGSTLLEIKQLQEARLTLLSALRLLERVKEEGVDLMNTAFLLGRVNEEELSLAKALAWYDRSLVILGRLDKDDEMMKARITYRFGLVKFAQRDFDEALKLLSEAQKSFLSLHGANNFEYAECVHSRGLIQFELKKLKDAKECFQSALQVRQRHLKGDDPELGESFHCLGEVLAELKHYQEASSCLGEALRIRLTNFGENGEIVGDTRRVLGSVELHLGKTNKSNDHYLEAIRIGMDSVQARGEMTDEEFDKLMQCFDAVIPLAKNGINPERLGKLFHQKGSLQSMHKQYKTALNSFTEAIQVYKAAYGEDHLNVANALFNVGVCLKETEDTDRAMKCFARALSISRSQLGDDHIEVAETMQQMAEVYRLKGDLRGAVKMCEQALQIRRYQEDEALAALLIFSGELYSSCDDGEEAERSFRECVRIRKKLLGNDNMDVSKALYSLGYVYETFRRDFRRSLRCYEEALRIRMNLMEDQDQDAARCYLHIGTVQSELNNETKAFYCFEKAISICTELEMSSGKVVEDAVVGQGHAYLAKGKAVEALAKYEEARKILGERLDGDDTASKELADLLVFQASALANLDKEHEALKRLIQALDMYKDSVGLDDLGTAGALHRLGELHLQMEDDEEALACAQQALTIRKSRLGKHDEATGDSYFIIGKIFYSRMDLNTARPCFEAALEIFRHRRGPAHVTVANCMYYLGCIHEFRRDWDESIGYFQAALPIQQKCNGRDDLTVADVLAKLGIVHKKRGEFELASDCLSECLRIRTNIKGPEDVLVADTLFELGGALKDSLQVSGKLEPSQCYVDAIRIYRETLGETHLKVAKCLARLGEHLQKTRELKKAGSCFEKAVKIFESKLDANPSRETMRDLSVERDYEAYGEALLDWATFLDNTGSDGSAMKTYRRALVLLQLLGGRNEEIIDSTLCRIANVLGRQDRFGEALQLLEQVKKRRIETVGENHPLVGDVFLSLAQLFEKKRDFYSAIASLENCLRIRRATVGPFTEDVAIVLTQLGKVKAAKADFRQALQSWDEAVAIYKNAGLSDDYPAVSDIRERQEQARQMLESTK